MYRGFSISLDLKNYSHPFLIIQYILIVLKNVNIIKNINFVMHNNIYILIPRS